MERVSILRNIQNQKGQIKVMGIKLNLRENFARLEEL